MDFIDSLHALIYKHFFFSRSKVCPCSLFSSYGVFFQKEVFHNSKVFDLYVPLTVSFEF